MATTTTNTQTPPVGATNTVYNRTPAKTKNNMALWVIGALIVAAIIVWAASQNRAQQAVTYSNPNAAPVVSESGTGTNTLSNMSGGAALPADTGTTAKDVDKTPVTSADPAN